MTPSPTPTLFRRLSLTLPATLLLLAALRPALAQVAQPSAGERPLWLLWNRHLAGSAAHADLAAECDALARAHPDDPAAPVARTIQAWHLMQLNQHDDAAALLEPLLAATGDGTARGAHELARAWLSRMDHERVRAALEIYRRRRVRYPRRLAELDSLPQIPPGRHPVSHDRYGTPWVYREERLQSMPSLEWQRYTLQSRTLGDDSALHEALAIPYATRIPFTPLRVFAPEGRPPIIGLARTDAAHLERPAASVGLGVWHEGVSVARISSAWVIMHDRLHWKIIPTPVITP